MKKPAEAGKSLEGQRRRFMVELAHERGLNHRAARTGIALIDLNH